MRITKVTTKTGDSGQTGLGNGERISKNSLRIHAVGSIDKLNSVIGWARIEVSEELSKSLERIQQDLFNLGGELAVPDVEMNLLSDERLRWLESHIENINDENPSIDPIAKIILVHLNKEDADKSFSPQQLAQFVADERRRPKDPPDLWRRYLPSVKQQALFLSRAGKLIIMRKGKPVDSRAAKGVIRYKKVS